MIKYKFIFSNGKLFFNKFQFFLFPINSFIIILHEIFQNESITNAKKLLKYSSFYDCKIIYEELKEKNNLTNKKILFLLKKINLFGMGELIFKKKFKNKYYFTIKNPILYLSYIKLYKKIPKIFPEEIFAGYLENFCSLLLEKKTICQIKYKNKNLFLELEVFENKNKIKKINFFNYELENINSLNFFVKKLILNSQIKINNGSLLIWKTHAIIIPYFYLIFLFSNLKQKKYCDFFSDLGRIQAKIAVEILQKKFGIRNNKKIFSQVLEQSELLGGGVIKFNYNENTYLLKNNLNTFLKNNFVLKDFILINIYFENLIKGSFEFSYNKIAKISKNKILVIENKEEKIILSEKEKKINEILKIKKLFNSF